MKLAIVGVTGLVGQTMLKVIEELAMPVETLFPVASEASIGKTILFSGSHHKIISIEKALENKPDIALFSAGSEVSRQWVPKFASNGTYVIDNSSAWRQHEEVPLVVPEVNIAILTSSDHIIANPNCSTIQMVVALAPIHRIYGLKRLVISTYQSVTGSGYRGMKQLEMEQKGQKADKPAYPHPIHLNLIPHGGEFDKDYYTSEERKLEVETRKILNVPQLAVTATVVRVPVFGGHSMTVNIETYKPFDLNDIKKLLEQGQGIELIDDPLHNQYPMPLFAQGKDQVIVGRVRRDKSISKGLNLWVVADNLRKGAATNAVQIAQYIFDNKFF